jgi:hypothetical protein
MKKIIFLLTFFASTNLFAQEVNYKVHSLFMYKFSQYIEWPESHSSGDFVIGVIGNSPVLEELQAIAASKKVGTRSISVKKLSPGSDLSGCHMVFLAGSQSGNIGDISAKLKGKPTLIVSEKAGLAEKGAGINFIIVDDKMKFELNKNNIQSQGLKVSGDLVKLAIVVG